MAAGQEKLLLLDLDNTLWDFDANAEEALSVLFHRHQLHLRSGFLVHEFVALYQQVNKTYWKRYERGEIDKDFLRTARFTDTFRQMGIAEEDHPEKVWEEYLSICPVMTRLVPGAMDFLDEMKDMVKIGLVTNGFDKTQKLKIHHSGIEKYIDFMVTSESIGIPKPNPGIFDRALQLASVRAIDTIYVGDTWDTDVVGGIRAGIPTIWFNRDDQHLPADGYSGHALFKGSAGSLLEASTIVAELLVK